MLLSLYVRAIKVKVEKWFHQDYSRRLGRHGFRNILMIALSIETSKLVISEYIREII